MGEEQQLSVPDPTRGREEVTALLARACSGDRAAVEQLYPLVHGALHARAVRLLAGREDHGRWQPTAVVSDVFLKLTAQRSASWSDRQHFYRIAAMAMRRIVVDWARTELRDKRGGGRRIAMPPEITDAGLSVIQLVELDDLLEGLAREHARSAQVVELRFFGGLQLAEIADVLGVCRRTVDGDWQFARAWLHERLAD